MADRPLPVLLRPLDALGAGTIGVVESLGRFGVFLAQAVAAMVTPPFRLTALADRIHDIGFRSLLIILLTGTFTGMVLGLQIYLTLSRFGSEAFLGPAVALSLIRELGPVLAALMVTGRAGSALTAELGIMRITEQIDALTVMALNPMRYLVAPSVLAGIVTFPLMTALFDVVGRFDPSLSTAEDVDWFARAKDAAVPAAVIPAVLLHKRVHDANLSINAVANDRNLLSAVQRSIARKRGRA